MAQERFLEVAGSSRSAASSRGTHTPTPWELGVGGNQHANRIWTPDMRPILQLCSMGMSPADIDQEAQANAAFIVKAVNNHDSLVAALKETTALVEEYARDCGPCEHAVGHCVCGLHRVAEAARLVLSRCEETQ